MATDFETAFLNGSSALNGGEYVCLVTNLTRNTQISKAGILAGADSTNIGTFSAPGITAAVGDEIVITFESTDETIGGNDMLFLKAESDEPVFATIGGLINDGNILHLNKFASENPDSSSTSSNQFSALLYTIGTDPIENHTGYIPIGDNSVSGWDTEAYQALEFQNAVSGDRFQFGIKFTINSENFNALHVKVSGGHPNPITTPAVNSTIMTVVIPINVETVLSNPTTPVPPNEPTFPTSLINTTDTAPGRVWAKLKNETKGRQVKSSALGTRHGERNVFPLLDAEVGDELVLTVQINDSIDEGEDTVHLIGSLNSGITSATVGGLLQPDDPTIVFRNATTGTVPFPTMTAPNPTTNNSVTFPTAGIQTEYNDPEDIPNLNYLGFGSTSEVVTVANADIGERWQASFKFTIPSGTSGRHAIAMGTKQGQNAPSFIDTSFTQTDFRFPINITASTSSGGSNTPLSEGPATDINYSRETKLFLYQDGSNYEIKLDGDFDFSQTFSEKSTSSNTLHNTQHFESSSIVKANPASFEFRANLLLQNDAQILFDNLINPRFCDLYFQTSHATFKIDRGIFTNGNFEIGRNSILKLSIAGEGALLQRVGDESYTIPGIDVIPSTTRTPFIPGIKIILNGRDISLLIANVQAEIQNDIKWVPYETMNQAIKVVDKGNAMYPSNFVLNKRIFAGSITKYVATGDESTLLNFDREAPLRIKAGKTISDIFYGLDFNMASCSFTNRVNPREIYTQNFDWRLTSNADLNGILKYFTLT